MRVALIALLTVAACTRREAFALVVTGLSRGGANPLPLPVAVCDRAPGQAVLHVLGSGFVPAVASANQNAKLLVPVVSLHDSRGNTSVVAEPELLDEGTIQVRVGPYNGSGQDGVYSVEVAGDRALRSANDSLTLIAQATIRPFANGKMREMHLFDLPWPKDVLQELGETPVRLRVTLSYFVEPNPARRGWRKRYRYASHGLRST